MAAFKSLSLKIFGKIVLGYKLPHGVEVNKKHMSAKMKNKK